MWPQWWLWCRVKATANRKAGDASVLPWALGPDNQLVQKALGSSTYLRRLYLSSVATYALCYLRRLSLSSVATYALR